MAKAKPFEHVQEGKFVLYEGDAPAKNHEGKRVEQTEPLGTFQGSARTSGSAKQLAAMRPDGQLYRRDMVVRYVPVNPADLPDDPTPE